MGEYTTQEAHIEKSVSASFCGRVVRSGGRCEAACACERVPLNAGGSYGKKSSGAGCVFCVFADTCMVFCSHGSLV